MLKYSFPNLTVSAFGDTGRPMQSIECLECAIKMASKYVLPILPDLVHAAQLLKDAGKYDRKKGGINALLWYLPQIPVINEKESNNNLWNRTGQLDFASCYLQRNGKSCLSLQGLSRGAADVFDELPAGCGNLRLFVDAKSHGTGVTGLYAVNLDVPYFFACGNGVVLFIVLLVHGQGSNVPFVLHFLAETGNVPSAVHQHGDVAAGEFLNLARVGADGGGLRGYAVAGHLDWV